MSLSIVKKNVILYVLNRLNLAKFICCHIVGQHHTHLHRMAVGGGITLIGIGISHLFSTLGIYLVGEIISHLSDAIGAIPLAEFILKQGNQIES